VAAAEARERVAAQCHVDLKFVLRPWGQQFFNFLSRRRVVGQPGLGGEWLVRVKILNDDPKCRGTTERCLIPVRQLQ
jgi:hypothetical protein